MDWSSFVSSVTPFVVKIQTQHSWGTGFIFWQNKELCCIATANHVIEPANQAGWEQPILITQSNGNYVRVYHPTHRWIAPKLNDGDSSAILVNKSGLNVPPDCLPLWNPSSVIPVGTEVGWLGYPQLVDQSILQPSFFSGIISNNLHALSQYTIDGVAIHGVSGAPVFCKLNNTGPHVIGTISSYFANRVPVSAGVETWPGIALSHSFSAFQPVIENLKTLEDAPQNTPPSDDVQKIDK